MTTASARSTARQAQGQARPWLSNAARVGHAANGVMHLVIAWLALQVATGSGAGEADAGGALRTIAAQPFGAVLLWVGFVGFAGLALLHLVAAAAGSGSGGGLERAKDLAKAAVYATLAVVTWQVVRGAAGGSGQQTADLTARLLQAPGGRLLVTAVGVAVIAVGGYFAHKGWRRRFLQDLREHPGTLAVRLGQAGHVAKGVALAVVGVLFVVAAWQRDPQEARGLDGALRALAQQPAGPVLLGVVALGLACFGAYCFVRAAHARD